MFSLSGPSGKRVSGSPECSPKDSPSGGYKIPLNAGFAVGRIKKNFGAGSSLKLRM